jgi:hypothetical protein
MDIPEVTAQQVSRLVHDIEANGFACISDYLCQTDLERMQLFVNGAIAQKGKEYMHFNGPNAVRGSGVGALNAFREAYARALPMRHRKYPN